MSGVLALGLNVLLVGAGVTAVVIVLRAGTPALAARLDAAALGRRGARRLAIGLLNGPALFLLAAALGGHPSGKPFSIVVFLVLIGLAVLGLVAELPLAGRRILALGGREASDLAAILAAGATLTACALLPLVGWAVCGVVVLMAIGTGVSWVFARRRRPSSGDP
jgi:hypothetical protein